MTRLGKLLRLSPVERPLLIGTYGVLTLVRLGLHILPYQMLSDLLAIMPRRPPERCHSRTRADDIALALDRSRRHMPGCLRCLPVALTSHVLMRWYGYTPHLCIGVAKDDKGQLKGHT